MRFNTETHSGRVYLNGHEVDYAVSGRTGRKGFVFFIPVLKLNDTKGERNQRHFEICEERGMLLRVKVKGRVQLIQDKVKRQ